MKCYLATSNPGKASELREIGEHFFPEINEWHARAPKDADEIGDTFLENAKIKAEALAEELISEGVLHAYVLADDSGLEVEALGGAPGVLSARYAGDHVEPLHHMRLLLQNLRQFKDIEDREANYTCALYLIVLEGEERRDYFALGTCEGFIGFEPRGESGFGYDPIFLLMDQKTTMAELGSKEKNEISHRWDAFEQLLESIREHVH